MACLVGSFEFWDSFNIVSVWDEGFPSSCLCLLVVCIVRRAEGGDCLLLQEFEAENFSTG